MLLLHQLGRPGPAGGGQRTEGEVLGGEAVAGRELVDAGAARHPAVVAEGDDQRLAVLRDGLAVDGDDLPLRAGQRVAGGVGPAVPGSVIGATLPAPGRGTGDPGPKRG